MTTVPAPTPPIIAEHIYRPTQTETHSHKHKSGFPTHMLLWVGGPDYKKAHSNTFEQGLPEKAGVSAAGQTLREFLCPSHPCGRWTAVGKTEHFAHAVDLSMDGSALEMEENFSKRGVLAKQCKFLSVEMYIVQQV